jgi:hypothetical protein
MYILLSKNKLKIISIIFVVALAVMLQRCHLNSTDPQGGHSIFCSENEDFKPISNNRGWTVTGHWTNCGWMGGASQVYIFVHPENESESRSSLVFRYSDLGTEPYPVIEWQGESEVVIRVNRVSQITKILSSIGAIRITYKILEEEYPRNLLNQ